MHPSSIQNMKTSIDLIGNQLNCPINILDVGGRSLSEENDRSYKTLFKERYKEYSIADIVNGPGVTHIMPSEYVLPFDDAYFDLIVSGQTLEHVKNPFKLVAEMKRVLKPSGFMILIAPSTGRRHDTIDCWRFMDDAFKAIMEDIGGMETIANWITNSAPDQRSAKWSDHTFIGRKV